MSIVILSHGKESSPESIKIKKLAEVAKQLGHEVLAVDYRPCGVDVSKRVDLLRSILQDYKGQDIILLGSSMGGYVSTILAEEVQLQGLFLLCPALYLAHYPKTDKYAPLTTPIEMVHGWADDIVPHENSIRFAHQQGATLHLVQDGHRLSASHDLLENWFTLFLKKILS